MNRIALASSLCAMTLSCLLLTANAQRLPDTALPEHYKVTLSPNFQTDDFTGEETIRVRVLKPTSSITLNAADINFQDASITSGNQNQQAKVTADPKKEMATLTVAQP